MHGISRRLALGAGLALAACRGQAEEPPLPGAAVQPLKSVAPLPVGCAVMSDQLRDPAYARLLTRHFSQLTPEWEMKMEYILKPDGTFRFDGPDEIAAFARAGGMRLLGHTLIWYAQEPEAFKGLDGAGASFASAYRNYIVAVAGRYRGQAAAWDVVNEPVAEDGEGYRDCIWRRNFGMEYVRRAFEHAREADPQALLLINDYNLENLPKKRATFMRLVEDLLKAGAPVQAVGTQSHVAADLEPGAYARAIRDLASLGLPIHISELEVSLNRASQVFTSRAELKERQRRVYGEVVEALMSLPARQRFALTLWGLRDRDSWLRNSDDAKGPQPDEPMLFDDEGRAKPVFQTVVNAFQARA